MAALFASSCSYDDSAIYSELDSIKNRISSLENSVTQLSDYQTIKDKVNNGKFITSYTQGTDGSYTLTFSDKTTITIKDGNDGNDGVNGTNGTNGINGANGKDGKDGKTPTFKIESESWYVSYDNGATWDLVGSAIDRSLFKAVAVEGENIKLTLADDTVVTLPIGEKNQFRLNVDESAVNVAYSSLLSSRTRCIDIPFTLSGKVENPRILVTVDYPYLSESTQMFSAVVTFDADSTSGVITVKQPIVNSRDGELAYLDAAEATVNIIAFNGDGQSSVRSKFFNSESIECDFNSSYLYELIKVEDGIPYYAIPKEGGPFKVTIYRTLNCKGISDKSKFVRPSSFDDVWGISFYSSYGTISDKSLVLDDTYFSSHGYCSEEYEVTFNVKPNPNTKERTLRESVGKFYSESNNSWVNYFSFALVQAGI